MKLFSFRCPAFQDDTLCIVPGFSHRSQPEITRVLWYPFKEWWVRGWIYARNRSHAVKQLRYVGNVRDLDGGVKCTVPACIAHLA